MGIELSLPPPPPDEFLPFPKFSPQVDMGLRFKYFESQIGLKFLLETGQLDPESRIPDLSSLKPGGPKLPDLELTQKIRSAWNPRLVDEPEETFVDTEELFSYAESLMEAEASKMKEIAAEGEVGGYVV